MLIDDEPNQSGNAKMFLLGFFSQDHDLRFVQVKVRAVQLHLQSSTFKEIIHHFDVFVKPSQEMQTITHENSQSVFGKDMGKCLHSAEDVWSR
jgi:hypothetical protein